MLAPGTRLGVYEVTATLGVGGMGEVYRAKDTRLHREVAIKVLPEAFAADPDRLTRFEREAQLLASLNHPNIAHIYGVEDSGGVRALAMELVEGPTLADRIALGPVPVDEALAIARQVAEALEAAHEHGVVHRDLKPANVKVRDDGTVKVLDFGLAKALDASTGPAASATMSPTLTVHATLAGVILGTAAYMSPEQARGRHADRRADIWAFGVVLYEMLSGRRAFEGDDLSITLAGVLKDEPDWRALPPDTPARLRTLIARCLKKDPRQRLQSIGDARLELADIVAGVSEQAAPGLDAATSFSRARRALPWTITAAALAGLSALSFIHLNEPAAVTLSETRTEIVTPSTSDPMSFALSPDGRQIVFVGTGEGRTRLWVRALSSTTARPLPGTEDAASPFWSPDSRSIAFVAEGRLKRLDLSGGAPMVLAPAFARGGTWNEQGEILFVAGTGTAVFRVAAAGGLPQQVTRLAGQSSHRWPQFLPDGRLFLFWALGGPDSTGIYLGSLDSDVVTRLTPSVSFGQLLPSGWLLWVRAGALVAQRIELSQGTLAGTPMTIADSVGLDTVNGTAAFSTSRSGLIAYRSSDSNRRQLRWFDRSGKPLGAFGEPDEAGLSTVRLSPDGRRAVVFRTLEGNTDIWSLDGARMTRLTFAQGLDRYPVFSRDGARFMFDSAREQSRDLYVGRIDSPGTETPVLSSPENKSPGDWSHDERFHVYHVIESQIGDWDLWILPFDESGAPGKPWPFLTSDFEERAPSVSPDGRWVAYQSDQSGRHEVYVRVFPTSGAADSAARAASPSSGQWQVSTSGGIRPTWRADGRELYYIDPGGRLMAASVVTSGATFEAGTPVPLFATQIVGSGVENGQGRQYDVSRDGRFLVNTVLDEAAAPITILQNWSSPVASP